jgi:Fur family peroxide stress response transcriptional regulator
LPGRVQQLRVAMLRLLASSDGHPSASHLYDQIKGQFPTTSPGTSCKTLNLLKETGEALELGFSPIGTARLAVRLVPRR